MRKFIHAILISGMMSSSVLAGSFAASVSDFSGKVLVNSGEGFLPISANAVLKIGDRVFVGEQSFAAISYASCAVLLDKPTVVEITVDGGCNGATSIQPVAVVHDPSSDAPMAASLPLPLILVGGAVVTTGIVCAVGGCKGLLDDDEDVVAVPTPG